MKVAVHWFRADLRLNDNAALHAATQAAEIVVPIFIFDPKILEVPEVSAGQVGFMLECLRSLERDVSKIGGRMTFRHGPVLEEMRAVLRESRAEGLFYHGDDEPYAIERDDAVDKMAKSLGVEVRRFTAPQVLKDDKTPYTVFGPYKRKWRAAFKPAVTPAVKSLRSAQFKYPKGIRLPSAKELGFKVEIPLPPGGEKAAGERLREFVGEGLLNYKENRNLPALGLTSRLSPHFRMGTLSAMTAWCAAEKAEKAHPKAKISTDTFVDELIWRDFYKQILGHFPHVAKGAFRRKYDALKWENNKRLFAAWCEGRTGYPLVDAGMRQLNAIGWMHNRVRMVTATFLTKDLLVSWQWGERYFMQKLLDADLAANNGGWQWCAGTGTDAQPWFRIFNPHAQARKFDPEGVYIKRYVPEIDTRDYPAPIVDHAEQRVKALALFRAVRDLNPSL